MTTVISQRKLRLNAMPKPKARGWIHAATAPLALANAIVLLVLAPTAQAKLACLVFGISSVVLFGHSAVYHLGTWSPKVETVLRRLDHSNIFLLIAGTYTPLAVSLLPGRTAIFVLSVVWVPLWAAYTSRSPSRAPRVGSPRGCTWPWDGSPSGTSPTSGRRAGRPSSR